MGFGDRLRAARQAAGLSQTELGGDAYSVSYISRLESGRRAPTPAVVAHCERTLGLSRGTLLAGDWAAPDDARADSSPAALAALASRAMLAWSAGAAASARTRAREGMALAERLDRPDVWWQLAVVDLQAGIRVGDYDDSAQRAEALLTHPWVQATTDLHAQAAVLSSNAHRLAGDMARARSCARLAAGLTDGYEPGDTIRMNALVAAVSTRAALDGGEGGLDDARLAELARGVDAADEPHSAGLAAWALGNLAFAAGRAQEGLVWHERADGLISPNTDFNNWVRFARASASERLAAGLTEGVEALLSRARLTCDALGNPNEAAALALAEADFAAIQGRPAEGVQRLAATRALDGVTPELRARVLVREAELLRQTGDFEAAAQLALLAARTYAEDAEPVDGPAA